MTSPTNAKMDAARPDPLRRCFEDIHQLGTRKTALFLGKVYTDTLSWQPKRDKDRPAILKPSHGITAIGECGQSNILFHKIIGRPVGSPIMIQKAAVARVARMDLTRACKEFTYRMINERMINATMKIPASRQVRCRSLLTML